MFDFMKQFESLSQAQKNSGICRELIANACNKCGGEAGGYRWNWKYNVLAQKTDGTSYFKGLSKKQQERDSCDEYEQ